MFNKRFLRKFFIASFAAGSLIFTPEIYGLPTSTAIVHAEIKEYVGVGESIVSDRETLEIGKQGAKLQAIRNAQEKAGVFIGSYSVVKNHELDTDEIVAFTAGVVKVDDNIKYEPIQVEQWIKYRATVVVTIDTNDLTAKVNQWVGRSSQDRSTLTEQTKALNGTLDMIQTRTVEIETAVLGASTTVGNEKVTEELKQIDRDILYAQKISEGNERLRNGDRDGAMRLYQEAIALYPKDATIAYEKLGDSYLEAKDYDRAIDAYTKVIQMDPNYAVPYQKRGKIYCLKLKEYRKAAADFEKVLAIAPKSEEARELLTFSYLCLDDYDSILAMNKEKWIDGTFATDLMKFAIFSRLKELTDVIKSGSATAEDYFQRGIFYDKLDLKILIHSLLYTHRERLQASLNFWARKDFEKAAKFDSTYSIYNAGIYHYECGEIYLEMYRRSNECGKVYRGVYSPQFDALKEYKLALKETLPPDLKKKVTARVKQLEALEKSKKSK